MASRFFCGVGAGMFSTILFAVLSSNYADQIQTVIASLEICTGLGLVAGPTMGSILYYIGGYFTPFSVLATFFAVAIPAVFVLLGPDREYIEKNKTLKASDLVKCWVQPTQSIFIDLINSGLLMLGIGFLTPTLTLHLISYGLSIEAAGILSVTNVLAYLVTAPLAAVLSNKINKSLMMTVGLLLLTLSFYCMGPISPLPNQLGMIVLGLVFLGLSFSATFSKRY
jgi:MFS family permease